MCSGQRLRGLYDAVRYVEENQIPGDIVECGVALGGSAAMMGLALRGANRQIWLFDTFEGLPAPNNNDPDYNIANHYVGSCKGELQEVMASFDGLGLKATPVKGLFQDTLPRAEVKQIAVLHLDGDWYDSTKICLKTLYDRVSIGGVVQLDDYGFWKGCSTAVREFFKERRITPNLTHLDYAGRQFVKE